MKNDQTYTPLIITGMHRSNTSLVAKSLLSSGLHMGDNLLPASPHNKEGYFEDKTIIDIEDEWLKKSDQYWYISDFDQLKAIQPDKGQISSTRQKVLDAFDGKSFFGWKSPRSILFLDYWLKVFPEAKFFFIFRHPCLVSESLVKRGDMWKFSKLHPMQLKKALKICEVYNRAMLDFFENHEEISLIFESPVDIDNTSKQGRINEKLRNWGFMDGPVDFESNVNPKLLRSKAPGILSNLVYKSSCDRQIYDRLKKLSSDSLL